MQLFFTDSSFIWNGVERPGIPFLCNDEMELVTVPNLFLRHVATVKGRTRSRNTWRTYANHLYEFFSFLETNGLNWLTLTETLMAAWRDEMTVRGCSGTTVNQRLNCVQSFYKWAINSKIISDMPFSTEEIRISKHSGMLAHVDSSGNKFTANELTLKTIKAQPKFLILKDALIFLNSLSPRLLKLMGYLALVTGMRREEITGLSYHVLPNPCGYDPKKQLPMNLDGKITPTKGMRPRIVMLPYDLAVMIWNYFCQEWPKRNNKYKQKNKKDSDKLFLSEYGDEFSIRYLNNSFVKTSKRIGISCQPHMLRHTYGTYELLRMSEKYGQTKALLWLKERMGHSSISTTEIYVHTIDLLKNTDVDGYQQEIIQALYHGS
jgi:site-specific recombinase XerD